MYFKNMVGYRIFEKFYELIFYYFILYLFGIMVFESMVWSHGFGPVVFFVSP